MDILREFELRLFDAQDRLVLVVPVVAGSQEDVQAKAAGLLARENAARFSLTPQLRSRFFRGGD